MTPDSNIYKLLCDRDANIQENEYYNDNSQVIFEDLQNFAEEFNYKKMSEYDFRSVYENYFDNLRSNGIEKQNSNTHNFPEFTNFSSEYIGCLDHIFINYSSFKKIISIIKLPSLDDVFEFQDGSIKGFPNEYFPSDHFPIGIDVI